MGYKTGRKISRFLNTKEGEGRIPDSWPIIGSKEKLTDWLTVGEIDKEEGRLQWGAFKANHPVFTGFFEAQGAHMFGVDYNQHLNTTGMNEKQASQYKAASKVGHLTQAAGDIIIAAGAGKQLVKNGRMDMIMDMINYYKPPQYKGDIIDGTYSYPETQKALPYKTQKALPYKTQKAPRVITRQKPPRTSDGVMRDVGSRVSLHPVPRPTAPPEARGELIRTIQNSMKTGKPFIIPPTFANGFPIKDMWGDLRDRFSDVRRGRNVEIRKEPGLVQNRTGNLINPQTGKADLPTASAVSMPMIYTGGAVPTYDSDINSLEDHVAVQVGYDTKVDFIKAIQYLQSLGKFKDDRFSVYETPAGLRIMDIGKALGEPQDPKMIDIFKQDKFYTSFTIQRYNKFLRDNGFDRQLTERAADITKLGVGAPYAARLSPKYGRKDDYVARKLFDFGGGKANPKAVDAVKKYHDNIIDIIKSEGAHINIDKLIRLIEE